MPMAFLDSVLEISTTAGTGNIALGGAVPSYRTFAANMAVGDTCWYFIAEVDIVGRPTGLREWGRGTLVSAGTLERTSPFGPVLGSRVAFAAGTTKYVGCTIMSPSGSALNDWLAVLGISGKYSAAGGTLTGPVLIAPATGAKAEVALRRVDVADETALRYQHGTYNCWAFEMQALATADFRILRGDGTTTSNFATFYRSNGHAEFNGLLSSNDSIRAPAYFLRAGGPKGIGAYTLTGLARWVLELGNASAETGGNAGSDFSVHRYSDSGAYLGQAFSIHRNSGHARLENGVSISTTPAVPFGITIGNRVPWGSDFTTGAIFADSLGTTARLQAIINAAGSFAVWAMQIGPAQFNFQSTGVASNSGGWVATSDARVKQSRAPITSALKKTAALSGCTFDRTDMQGADGLPQRRAGLIAQDVLAVLPEAVHVPEGYDPADAESPLLALDHNGVIGLLVEAVKELHARVRELEAAR